MTERKVVVDGVEIPFEKLESQGWTPPQPPEEEPDRDPYLVPGVVCEVWYGDDANPYVFLKYFSARNDNDQPIFVNRRDLVGKLGSKQDHYRVIGTPWDHAPDEAEWIATDKSGQIFFFDAEPTLQTSCWLQLSCYWDAGYDRAVASGKVDWTTTLRRRPEWARRERE